MGGGPVIEAPYLVGYWRRPYCGIRLPVYKNSFPVSRNGAAHPRHPGASGDRRSSDYNHECKDFDEGGKLSPNDDSVCFPEPVSVHASRLSKGSAGNKESVSSPLKGGDSARDKAIGGLSTKTEIFDETPGLSNDGCSANFAKTNGTVVAPIKAERSEDTSRIASDLLSTDEEMIPSLMKAGDSDDSRLDSSLVEVETQSPCTYSHKNNASIDTEKDLPATESVETLAVSSASRAGNEDNKTVKSKEVTQKIAGNLKGIRADQQSSAAILVQSNYRGHVVRRALPLKHLRIIAGIRNKLKELDAQARDADFQDAIRNGGSMAKLKFSESTMALLLQLDDIQGVHPVVRDIRKAVTREVIHLQERMDAVA